MKGHVYLGGTPGCPDANLKGFESLQYELLYCSPKYGNDDEKADRHAIRVFDLFHDAVAGNPNSRGRATASTLLPTTSHVYFGSVTGATPDGRGLASHCPKAFPGTGRRPGTDRRCPFGCKATCAPEEHCSIRKFSLCSLRRKGATKAHHSLFGLISA